ncbi:MAG: ABC transporter permease subunit [Bradymonadaceae bacterium]
MKGLYLVARRELGRYFNSIWGFVVVAAILVIDGLLFNAFALGAGPKKSTEVLRQFFYFSFGTTVVAGILLTIRLVAEERETGTLTLLDASPLSDWQIVGGKYLAALTFLSGMTLLTVYMPALIFVNGKVSIGHIAAGYLGLILVGSATVAIGTFASTLTESQVVAGIVGGIIAVFLLITWLLARVVSAPFDSVFSYMAMFNRHFSRSFMQGRVETNDLVYYATVTFAFLMLSVRWLAARRWR